MKYCVVLIIVLISISSYAQTLLVDYNGETITIDNSNTNFELGDYSLDTEYTITICTGNVYCNAVRISINSINIGSDNICVFDGPSITDALIECNNISNSYVASESNSSGCITMQFTLTEPDLYFYGYFSCQSYCQDLSVEILSDPAWEYYNGQKVIDVCQNTEIELEAIVTYSNLTYPQNSETSSFKWNVNGLTVSQDSTFIYNIQNEGISRLSLLVFDTLDCVDMVDSNIYIRYDNGPNLNFTPENYSVIPTLDTSQLMSQGDYPNISNDTCSSSTAQGIYLDPVTKYVYINSFEPGAVLENVDDILGICLGIQHTFLGDLDIEFTCPYNNEPGGETSVLLTSNGNYPYHLGVVNSFEPTAQGELYNYCWTTPNNAYHEGTMQDFGVTNEILPAGSYESLNPLTPLIGCSLNGIWKLKLTDNWAMDYGFISCFELYLNGDNDVVPQEILIDVDSAHWQGNFITDQNNGIANIVPTAEGVLNYQYEIFSNTGCTHNYNLILHAVESPSLVSGQVFNDTNINCEKDEEEVGLSDRIIEITPGPVYANTNAEGVYAVLLGEGTYDFKLIDQALDSMVCLENYTQEVLVPFNDTTENVDFANYIGSHIDLDIDCGSSIARPGLIHLVISEVVNTGTEAATNVILKYIKIPEQTFVTGNGSSQASDNDTISMSLGNLLPGESRQITLKFLLDTDIGIDYSFQNIVSVYCDSIDFFPNNNIHELNITTQGPFDPNIKVVEPEGDINEDQEYLDYTIHFQNVGNDTAFNVLIVDTISQNLDMTSINTGVSSHDYTWELIGENIIKFKFDDIMLLDSLHNEPESHGFVCYRVNVNPDLLHNDEIRNSAHIYFDYNEAIQTNTTINTIIDIFLSDERLEIIDVSIYPNPASDYLQINSDEVLTWVIHNSSGYPVLKGKGSDINIEELPERVYIISLFNVDTKLTNIKFVKL